MTDGISGVRLVDPLVIAQATDTEEGVSRSDLLEMLNEIVDTVESHDEGTKYRFDIQLQEIKEE